jgi:hypothetical protein
MNHSDEIKNNLTTAEKLTNIFIVLMIAVFGGVVSLLAWALVEALKA